MASPRIVITYCTQCKWLLRAQWYAAEMSLGHGDRTGPPGEQEA